MRKLTNLTEYREWLKRQRTHLVRAHKFASGISKAETTGYWLARINERQIRDIDLYIEKISDLA